MNASQAQGRRRAVLHDLVVVVPVDACLTHDPALARGTGDARVVRQPSGST